MTPDEMKAAVEEARCYLRGREFGGPGTAGMDKICGALLAAHAECERMRPVYEAAERYTRHSRAMQTIAQYNGSTLKVAIEVDRAHHDIMRAIDTARTAASGEG